MTARRATRPARLRGAQGRFLRKLRMTPAGDECWLVWSLRYHAWHAASYDGGHGGYTTHIAEAGLFTRDRALVLHDGLRNEAFHVSDKVDLIDHEISVIHLLLGNLHDKAHAARKVAA